MCFHRWGAQPPTDVPLVREREPLNTLCFDRRSRGVISESIRSHFGDPLTTLFFATRNRGVISESRRSQFGVNGTNSFLPYFLMGGVAESLRSHFGVNSEPLVLEPILLSRKSVELIWGWIHPRIAGVTAGGCACVCVCRCVRVRTIGHTRARAWPLASTP